MSESKPKKAASEKAASKAAPKAEPASSEKTSVKGSRSKKPAKADGVELARRRRLTRAGFEGADCCPLLGVALETGPRAPRLLRPLRLDGEVVSSLAALIIESGVSPEALELAAARLRERQAEEGEQ